MNSKYDLKRKLQPSAPIRQRIPDVILEIVGHVIVDQNLGAVFPVKRVCIKPVDVVKKLFDSDQLAVKVKPPCFLFINAEVVFNQNF